MQCCRGRLGLQALRVETWAAVMGQARKKQAMGERSTCSFQGRDAKICGSRASQQQQQQGKRPPAQHAAALLALSCPHLSSRLFSSSARNGDESEGQADPPVSVLSSAQLAGNRRKRAWGKSLSPLERVSRLVPEEFLSEEVNAMRSTEAKESVQEPPVKEEEPSLSGTHALQAQIHLDQDLGPEPFPHTASKNIPFQLGELIVAEFHRRRKSVFRKLCKLTPGGLLSTTWGTIPFVDVLGTLPGQLFFTSTGQMFLIRRPALEDYVMLMKRGPTISYPKDMNAMLLLMDIGQGDIVLEAGSGSGAMSLFLSRAVGPQGRVISYEIRKDHHILAKANYQNWRAAWERGHTVEWPDNVEFINEAISTATEGLKMKTFDAVALDMVIPQNVLPVIVPSLKQGGVCAVYVANITQVIDLLEAVQKTSKSALFCEKIVEVTHRDWLVNPVTQKYGTIFQHMNSTGKIVGEPTCYNEDELYAEQNENDVAFVSNKTRPPYIARPCLWQHGHTVFLVKLRKFNLPKSKCCSR